MRGPLFRQLDRYEILARLSEGAFGEVYAACLRGSADFSTLVAIKVLHPGRRADGATLAAFAEEARLGGRLIHPNIARVIEFLEVDGQFLLVMELVDGVSFVQLIMRQAEAADLPPATVMEMIAQACDGLHYAHEARDDAGRPLHLVHRDIKPSNLMLDRAGLVKVMDFGIAKVHLEGRDPTVTGIIKGTPAYMAPELARGERRIDRRADTFALGIVAWELLMGERLYVGSQYAVLHQAAEGRHGPQLDALGASIHPAVVEAVRRALSPDPDQRYATAAVMAEAFRSAADALGVAPRVRQLAQDVAPPPVRATSRSRWVAVPPPADPAEAPTVQDKPKPEAESAEGPTRLLPAAPARSPRERWLGIGAGGTVAGIILAIAMVAGQRGNTPDSEASGGIAQLPSGVPAELAAGPVVKASDPPTPAPPTNKPIPPTPRAEAAPAPRAIAAAPQRRPSSTARRAEADPRKTARVKLTFNTAPEEQPIWVDGALQSRPTPWSGALSPGRHSIAVGEGMAGQVSLTLEDGKPALWLGFLDGKVWRFEQIQE